MIETVGQLANAVRDHFGERVQIKNTYRGKWLGGYHFVLDTGFIVSVQFAPGLAGDYGFSWILDRMDEGLALSEIYKRDYDFSDSLTAEVCVMKKGDYYDLDTMQSLPEDDWGIGVHVPAADVFKLIEKFSGVEVVC